MDEFTQPTPPSEAPAMPPAAPDVSYAPAPALAPAVSLLPPQEVLPPAEPMPQAAVESISLPCPVPHTSRDRLFRLALAVAVLNPIFSGLLMAWYLWRESGMQREARIVLGISVVWGAVLLGLVWWLRAPGM